MVDRLHSKEQDVILDSISEGVFTVSLSWQVTFFNRAAEEITGVERGEAVGRQCRDVFRADVCETECALRETMRTGMPIVNKAVHIIDANGKRRAIAISTALLKDQNGEVIGGVETIRDMTLVEELRKELEGRYYCEDIISQNHRMQEIFRTIPHIAESDCTVLIEGESGTGKELFARAIHNLSLRKDKPFVAVNCGALPDSLLESELFGYKAGAFTDAKKDKPGRFALAEGGTLFLDEIGDVSPAMQVRLLRVLQEHTYEPLGGVESVTTDVRIITATNKKVNELVEQGKFRDDLYYRINVMRLEIPPLRERKGDIPLLVDYFINRLNGLRGKNITCATTEALASLLSHDYPGNVRELENILEHCFVFCQGEIIQKEHLPVSVCPLPDADQATTGGVKTLKQVEVILIIEALRRSKGNQTAASQELGINKSTLYRKLKAYDIKPEAYT